MYHGSRVEIKDYLLPQKVYEFGDNKKYVFGTKKIESAVMFIRNRVEGYMPFINDCYYETYRGMYNKYYTTVIICYDWKDIHQICASNKNNS